MVLMQTPVKRAFQGAWARVPRSTEFKLQRMGRLARNFNHYARYQLSRDLAPEILDYAYRIRQDGFLVLPNLVPAATVTAMREAMHAEIAAERVVPLKKLLLPKGVKLDRAEPLDWNTVDLGLRDAFAASRHFFDFALNETVVQIATAYFGLYAGLHQFHVWRNPRNDLEPMGSFQWHRDPEGPYLLKTFLYLNDVDDETTHFTFVQGSHTGEHVSWRTKFRLTDEEMRALIPEERWVHFTGPAGTLIFADTNGFHRGTKGTKPREMATGVYTAYPHRVRPEIDPPMLAGLSRTQKAALRFSHVR